MTKEEKAKAYDEALRRAKSLYGENPVNSDRSKVCSIIFPQLKESEDERIRKQLIDIVAFIPEANFQSALREDCRAYLEKQKEQKPKVECDRAQPVEQAGTAEPDYGICGDFVPGKLAAALRRHGWYLGHVGENQQMVEARKEEVMRNWPADRYSLTQEQKPAEWSEEDEEMIGNIISSLRGYMCLASKSPYYSNHETHIQKEIEFLNSLRPSWKPTDEQMEAFRKYLEDFQARAEAAVGGWNNFDVMIRLYEQLKKLM